MDFSQIVIDPEVIARPPWWISGETKAVLSRLPKQLSPGMGCVYVLQLSDDDEGVPGLLKIGASGSPKVRIGVQCSQLRQYASHEVRAIAVSWPHVNFRENERLLHVEFDDTRQKRGEVFHLPFSEVAIALRCLERRDASGRFDIEDIIAALTLREEHASRMLKRYTKLFADKFGRDMLSRLSFDPGEPD